ncbi:MAG: NFACT RNA binding domain-containing protein [Candidatus Pacearchaeota archaeon]
MKFREFKTSSGKLVIAGKSAETNEDVIKLAEPNEIVLHTKSPGSPFCVIKGKAGKKDIKEAAIFCAKYSRHWKKTRADTEIHYFLGKDIYKEKEMKIGTFGVKKAKKLTAKAKDIESFEGK